MSQHIPSSPNPRDAYKKTPKSARGHGELPGEYYFLRGYFVLVVFGSPPSFLPDNQLDLLYGGVLTARL